MKQLFITNIFIENVRHLSGINILLSESERKHLILTGKNGSGKTSLLEAMSRYLSMYSEDQTYGKLIGPVEVWKDSMIRYSGTSDKDKLNKLTAEKSLKESQQRLDAYTAGIKLGIPSETDILEAYNSGNFILAYYKANREYRAEVATHIEKIRFNDKYKMNESVSIKLLKYLLDLKTTQSFAANEGKTEDARKIKVWFEDFEKLLRNIFDDTNLTLEFNYNDYTFTINTANRKPFGFNEMSSGYSAIFNIVIDLVLRMENNARRAYDIQGIVLIDEIETHLHIEMQEKIMGFITGFFPNIQFIVTTHSPFVLNSAENCVIYDLENNKHVANGLNAYTVSGVVKGYFEADTLSSELRERFNRYKELTQKPALEDEDYAELADLEFYLDKIPEHLSLEFSAEYQRLKLEAENRG